MFEYTVTYAAAQFLFMHCSCRRGKKEGRRESLQVRSVSELAKLVTSGKIRVPKSLVDYVDDRAQLLDQVFTILSPSDIKGMLPDILKVWVV